MDKLTELIGRAMMATTDLEHQLGNDDPGLSEVTVACCNFETMAIAAQKVVADENDKKYLPTMRSELDVKRLPANLNHALRRYDGDREWLSFERAESLLDIARRDLGDTLTGRLARGLKQLTVQGVGRMARRHAGLCKNYVRGHTGDLMTLQGLFYWNGSDELVTRILLLAWKKGGEQCHE